MAANEEESALYDDSRSTGKWWAARGPEGDRGGTERLSLPPAAIEIECSPGTSRPFTPAPYYLDDDPVLPQSSRIPGGKIQPVGSQVVV